jgi:hypothetical protein
MPCATPLRTCLKEAQQPLSDASRTGVLEADWHRHFLSFSPKSHFVLRLNVEGSAHTQTGARLGTTGRDESPRRCVKIALERNYKIIQTLVKVKQNFVKKRKKMCSVQITVTSSQLSVGSGTGMD